MPNIMKISPQGQIRIPKKVLEFLQIDAGDYVEIEVVDGQIALKPRKLIDPLQGWYWTKEWQKIEADVDDEIEKGKVSSEFKSAEEGLKWLKE